MIWHNSHSLKRMGIAPAYVEVWLNGDKFEGVVAFAEGRPGYVTRYKLDAHGAPQIDGDGYVAEVLTGHVVAWLLPAKGKADESGARAWSWPHATPKPADCRRILLASVLS
jgi:hypothetical protein